MLTSVPAACARKTSSSALVAFTVRKSTASIRLKIAVFAPMPSASESTAAAVNPGDFAICRAA